MNDDAEAAFLSEVKALLRKRLFHACPGCKRGIKGIQIHCGVCTPRPAEGTFKNISAEAKARRNKLKVYIVVREGDMSGHEANAQLRNGHALQDGGHPAQSF